MAKIRIILIISFYFVFITISNSQSLESTLKLADKYYYNNNYNLAQKNYLIALKEAEEKNKFIDISTISMSLARCYYNLYDHAQSFKWSYYSLNNIKKNNLTKNIGDTYYFLGALYIEAENIDSAEKYSLKAIEIFKSENDYTQLSKTYSTLVELHLNTSHNEKIIEDLLKNAENYAQKASNNSMIAFAASKRYNYYFFLKKNYQEALNYINKAEMYYLKTNNREAILNSFRGKAECLIMLRDTLARTYMLKWFKFKDSILQVDKVDNIAKYETLYETEKKEKEIKLLVKKNQLNRLLLSIIGVSFILLIAFGFIYYYRNNLIKKKAELLLLQRIQQDKERIARDLHDNVGGQLSFIIYSLDGINTLDADKRLEVSQSINESVRSVITSLRETIWAISDDHIKIQDFSDKLKIYGRNLFKHSNCEIKFLEKVSDNIEFNPLLGLNLFRICQEILINSFKHSKATLINIEILSQNNRVTIFISDNGVGFNESIEKKENYGLQNINKRAVEFNISVTIKSSISIGTKYTLIV